MRVLLIEDDPVISERIATGLTKAGYDVDTSADGADGLSKARGGPYSVIILDLMLPIMDGWQVCESLRAGREAVPILMLTARDEIEDRVRGLDCGADDYLTKPFDFRELLARVKALMRRDKVLKGQVIAIADLVIDTGARSVQRGGVEVHLTPREYSLLEALARNAGRTLSREAIQERVWGDEDSFSNVVSFHVAILRKKIDSGFPVKLIHTIYGVGYVLRAPRDEDLP